MLLAEFVFNWLFVVYLIVSFWDVSLLRHLAIRR